ncbi:MAG: csd 2 [Acidobacteria bacterium]|nr:csd 2 [Acidobacteriota bacterium]
MAASLPLRATIRSVNKTELRSLFPVTRNVVYLNHAAVGPLSTRAYDAIERHARDQREYGALHWREWYAEHAAAKEGAATLLHAKPAEIAIVKNTSEGLSFVAEGLRWREGENAVTTDLEFPSNMTPWKRLARRGVELRIAQSRGGRVGVDELEPLLDAKTRIVSVSSVAFHNGFAADLEAIGALCADRHILFCVDAIQSLGVLPIDVHRAKISFLAADGHKWLCSTEGAGIFFVAEECVEELEVLENGWTNFDRKGRFLDCPVDLWPDARRFEAGSLNTNGLYSLHAAIDLLLELGIENVRDEVLRLATLLADRLEAIGWTVRTPRPIASGIVGATPPNVESPESARNSKQLLEWHLKLEQAGIVCAPREGMLRFAPHCYNDDEEVERVISVLSR